MQTLFGSNFFAYSQQSDELTIASNFWVYIIAAIISSGATVLLWHFWKRRRAQTTEKVELESQKRVS